MSWPRSASSGRGVGDDAKLENSAGDLPEQLHLREDRRHALIEDRGERPAPIHVDAAHVLGRQLDRRQRVLDVVGDLPRHVGPRLETLGALELAPLPLEVVRHLVEVLDEAAQFVR